MKILEKMIRNAVIFTWVYFKINLIHTHTRTLLKINIAKIEQMRNKNEIVSFEEIE